MPITAQLKQIYASAPSGVYYVETLALSHSAFATRYVNSDTHDWTFSLENGALQIFTAVRFKVTWPTMDGQGQQDMQVVMDNVGREAMDAIDAAAQYPMEPIVCTVRIYLNAPNSFPQNDPPIALNFTELHVTNTSITGVATRVDVLNRPFPSLLYQVGGPNAFPGLDR